MLFTSSLENYLNKTRKVKERARYNLEPGCAAREPAAQKAGGGGHKPSRLSAVVGELGWNQGWEGMGVKN